MLIKKGTRVKPILLSITLIMSTHFMMSSVWSTTVDKTFRAERLEVDGFSGQLRVDVESRTDIAVEVRGTKVDIDGLDLSMRGGTLRVVDQRSVATGGNSSSTVVSVGNVTAISHGGGTASVSIGGRDFSAGKNSNTPLALTLRIPTGLPLVFTRLNGTCHIGDTNGSVELTLTSGDCTVGAMAKGILHVEGSGTIVAHEVNGDLRTEVTGSGDIRVESGHIGKLQAILSGSGQMTLDVHAEQAVLSLTGAGDIHVTEVRERPRINISGAGNVTVNNWAGD